MLSDALWGLSTFTANYIVKVNYSFINIREAFKKTLTFSDE